MMTRLNHNVNMTVLMDEFRRLPGIGSTELRRLNQCRLYLQVTLLSEISSSANGVTILSNYVRGNKHANRRSLLTWPRQERPPHKAWQEWNKRLSQTFCTSRTGFRLRQPTTHGPSRDHNIKPGTLSSTRCPTPSSVTTLSRTQSFNTPGYLGWDFIAS